MDAPDAERDQILSEHVMRVRTTVIQCNFLMFSSFIHHQVLDKLQKSWLLHAGVPPLIAICYHNRINRYHKGFVLIWWGSSSLYHHQCFGNILHMQGNMYNQSTMHCYFLVGTNHSRLTPEAGAVLQQFYLSLRKQRRGVDSIPITTRQFESLIRLVCVVCFN